uniref:Uncharacterized protein n=1 Tax=candidate division WOR-3 bacterium TaxID=2052148 RepID=A0A7C4U625_UNCW3
MNISTDIWVWIAALLTLFIYSFLYKDNPFYKFAEHLFIGIGVGYTTVLLWFNSVIPKLWNPLVHGTSPMRFFLIIPILIGALMFSIFSKKNNWLIRIPIAIYIGAGSGLAIPLDFEGLIFEQVKGTILTKSMFNSFIVGFSSIVLFIGVIATLVYFYFSKEHKGFVGKTARVGIFYIMIAFGASFGYTVMARVSLLIGRMQFLLHNWLGIIK